MQYFLIRHAQTDANRATRAAYGKQGAPINEAGLQQAKILHQQLVTLGVDLTKEPVAISELLRTKQTAEAAGFKHFAVYDILNEVNTSDPQKTQELIQQRKLPEQALRAAQNVLDHPPKERFWVTHGQVIAALLVLLNASDPQKFVPDFCEIRTIHF